MSIANTVKPKSYKPILEGYYNYYEEIHHIGAIQDQGYVIAVKIEGPENLRIVSLSENLLNTSLLEVHESDQVLGRNIFELFELHISQTIAQTIQRFQTILLGSTTKPFSIGGAVRNFALLKMLTKSSTVESSEKLLCCSVAGVANEEDTYILELEIIATTGVNVPNTQILQAGDIVSRIRAADNTSKAISSAFLDALMEMMPDYDRGMVYQFRDDFCGDVIHEVIRDPTVVPSSYLNLRFPAEDIPAVARELFMKNVVRFIYDVHGTNVPILSVSDKPLDLSLSCLRAVSECHLAYLRNMGVVSTMSIAIVVNNALWGLYTFHSYKKNTRPNTEQRINLEMVASISAMRIDACERDLDAKRKIDLNSMMLQLPSSRSIHEFLRLNYIEILKVFDAHAIILYIGIDSSEKVVYGDNTICPTEEGYHLLVETIKSTKLSGEVLFESEFSSGLDGNGAGIAFYMNQDAIIAVVRRSSAHDVSWGGNPDVKKDPSAAQRLQPRESFLLYMEHARLESKKFSPIDKELLQSCFDRISSYMHTEMLATFRISLDQSNAECVQAMEAANQHYEFFAHMSHELRTPFHGVISSLQILNSSYNENIISKISEGERKEIVQSALECGKVMLCTLNDILTIAKSRNCMEIVPSAIVLSKIFSSIKKMMGPIAENKSIHFTCHIIEIKVNGVVLLLESDWKSLVVNSDETRIGQIINNLTSNAIKFAPNGGRVEVRFTVGTYQDVMKRWELVTTLFDHDHIACSSQNNSNVKESEVNDEINGGSSNWLIFEVEDNGCGVPGDAMQVMFNAYKQLSSGISKTYQGTGLGLHICRLHVELMNGMLGLASTYGRGTVFFCALPITIAKTEYTVTSKVKTPDSVFSSQTTSTMDTTVDTISDSSLPIIEKRNILKKDAIFLVVDDSNVNLRLTKRKLLLAFGDSIDENNIKFALDGIEATEIYERFISEGRQKNIAVVLMDYHMPRRNGLEAIQDIRRIESAHNLKPVLIASFTADVTETSNRTLLNAGANFVLPKPTPGRQMEDICIQAFG